MSEEMESTPESQEPAPQTVRESIAAALATREEPREPEPEQEPEPLAAEDDGPPAEDVQPEGEVADEAEATNVEAAVDEEVQGIDAPAHWSNDFKDSFNALPSDAQEVFLQRYKDMEGDYTRKTQEVADIRRRASALDEVMVPFRDEFARAGLDDIGAVRQLLGAHKFLRESPQQAIAWLAQNYGINTEALAASEQAEDDFADPQVKQLRDQVSQLQGYLQTQAQQQQNAAVADTQQQITNFASVTKDDGSLAHPHFDAVRTTMGGLIQSGVAKDMDAAYEMAVYANSELRGSMIEQQAEKVTAKQKQAENVRKAKRAQQANVKGSGVPAKEALPGGSSVRDALLHTMKELQS